jgi:hypothetical protein
MGPETVNVFVVIFPSFFLSILLPLLSYVTTTVSAALKCPDAAVSFAFFSL